MLAIYSRVSTDAQTTAMQDADLAKYANGQEHRAYTDSFTGATMDRPGFNDLLAAVRSGEITEIAVWRLDRLGRSASGLCMLFEELRARNVRLVSLKDGFDLSTPVGLLLAQILASIAQFEREGIRLRQKAGIAAAKAKGISWGGSEKGRVYRLTPDKLTAIKTLSAQGMTIGEIARAVGLSRPTITKALAQVPVE